MSKIITQKCKVENCEGLGKPDKRGGKHYLTRGYCGKHYRRLCKYGDVDYVYVRKVIQRCKIENCEGLGLLGKNGKRYFSKGYCVKHYKRLKKYGDTNFTKYFVGEHRSENPLYKAYAGIKRRCYSESSPAYSYYGGRGIRMADRWLGVYGFTNFIEDMGDKPSDKHSIDRIDNNKGYSPDNCRWATIHQQAANRRNNNYIVGVSYIAGRKRWAAELKVNGIYYRKKFKNKDEAVEYRKQLELRYLD